MRLFNSLVVEAELVTYEAQINDKLENVKEEKVNSLSGIIQS